MNDPLSDPASDPQARFESIKRSTPYGAEYWSARELAPLLGYKNWERVPELIERAKAACGNAGQTVEDHFRGSSKRIVAGKGAQREVDDHVLSRFGCYLFAMNGDPRKPEIAAAQAYFAVQTRRAEQWEELREQIEERAALRLRLADSNKRLNGTAQEHGLASRSFGRLHDAGTRGLYGGMSVAEIKTHKGIGAKEDLADRMGRAELIANDFVRSQTEEKIRNEQICGTEPIIATHHEVGSKTRDLIVNQLGSRPPEELPPEPSIRPLLAQRARHEKQALQQDGPTLFDTPPAAAPGDKAEREGR